MTAFLACFLFHLNYAKCIWTALKWHLHVVLRKIASNKAEPPSSMWLNAWQALHEHIPCVRYPPALASSTTPAPSYVFQLGSPPAFCHWQFFKRHYRTGDASLLNNPSQRSIKKYLLWCHWLKREQQIVSRLVFCIRPRTLNIHYVFRMYANYVSLCYGVPAF